MLSSVPRPPSARSVGWVSFHPDSTSWFLVQVASTNPPEVYQVDAIIGDSQGIDNVVLDAALRDVTAACATALTTCGWWAHVPPRYAPSTGPWYKRYESNHLVALRASISAGFAQYTDIETATHVLAEALSRRSAADYELCIHTKKVTHGS